MTTPATAAAMEVYPVLYVDSNSETIHKIQPISFDETATIADLKERTVVTSRGRKLVVIDVCVTTPLDPIPNANPRRIANVLIKEYESIQNFLSSELVGCYDQMRLSEQRLLVKAAKGQIFLIVVCKLEETTSLQVIREEGRRGTEGIAEFTMNRESLVAKIRQAAQSPSQAATSEALRKTQKPNKPDAIYNGRPPALTGERILIYHPVFQQFINSYAEPFARSSFSRNDFIHAAAFVDNSLSLHDDEAARQFALKPSLSHFLGSDSALKSTHLLSGKQLYIPDGHIPVTCTLYDQSSVSYRLMCKNFSELKDSMGGGSCGPMEQAEKDYLLICVTPELKELRDASCMPALLLAIAGPVMALSGSIFVDGVVSEMLTDWISITPVGRPSNVALPRGYVSARDYHIYRIAHFFKCMRACLDTLDSYYGSMDSNAKPNVLISTPSHPAPYFQPFPLRYVSRIVPRRTSRSVFLAEDLNDSTRRYVVKFTDRYGEDAHRFMSAQNAAPELLYCNWEPTVGLYVVVTPYIDQTPDAILTTEGRNGFVKAMEKLHEANFVFGDLRPPNVLVDSKGNAQLVDFDWSETVEEARYPSQLRTDGMFPNGVVGGDPITKEHDKEMLQRYLRYLDTIPANMDTT